jgi:hypothetical protein
MSVASVKWRERIEHRPSTGVRGHRGDDFGDDVLECRQHARRADMHPSRFARVGLLGRGFCTHCKVWVSIGLADDQPAER